MASVTAKATAIQNLSGPENDLALLRPAKISIRPLPKGINSRFQVALEDKSPNDLGGGAMSFSKTRPNTNGKPGEQRQVADLHQVTRDRVQVDGKEPFLAIDETSAEQNVSNGKRAGRWRAFDRLLYLSFAPISPAYLFNSFDRIE